MSKKAEAMSIRINAATMAAIDMFAAELRIKEGKSVPISEIIWRLIDEKAPHVTQRIKTIEAETQAEKEAK